MIRVLGVLAAALAIAGPAMGQAPQPPAYPKLQRLHIAAFLETTSQYDDGSEGEGWLFLLGAAKDGKPAYGRWLHYLANCINGDVGADYVVIVNLDGSIRSEKALEAKFEAPTTDLSKAMSGYFCTGYLAPSSLPVYDSTVAAMAASFTPDGQFRTD